MSQEKRQFRKIKLINDTSVHALGEPPKKRAKHNTGTENEKTRDFDSMSFEYKINYWLEDIEQKDKLLTYGWLRENSKKKNIPDSIVNFCIIYGFVFDGNQDLYIGNFNDNRQYDVMNEPTVDCIPFKHKLFISASEKMLIRPKGIECVKYHCSDPPKQEWIRHKAPFYLEKQSWSPFIIEATIIYKKVYQKKHIQCVHYVAFNDIEVNLTNTRQEVEVHPNTNITYEALNFTTYKTAKEYPIVE